MENFSNYIKIQFTVPIDYVEEIREAVGQAGGGSIGNYSYCSFVTYGEGYFKPLNGANPAIGEIGKLEKVKEAKLEFICQKDRLRKVLQAIKKVHPYEEIAWDLIPLLEVDI